MTHIDFECPFCSRPMKVPASAAGKSGKCKSCKNTVIVPKRKTEPEAPPTTEASKRKRRFSPLMQLLTLVLVGCAVFVAYRFFGTREVRWQKTTDGTDIRYLDTESLWTKQVLHREVAVFLENSETLVRTMSGDMDPDGRPHGEWKVIDFDGKRTTDWYWHGEGVSEAQFEWRSK